MGRFLGFLLRNPLGCKLILGLLVAFLVQKLQQITAYIHTVVHLLHVYEAHGS